MDLRNASALVTGAASGLGAATAHALAERGTSVYGLDLAHTVASAEAVDGVTLVGADVTSGDEVAAALARINSDGPCCALPSTARASHRPRASFRSGDRTTSAVRQRAQGEPARDVQCDAVGRRGDGRVRTRRPRAARGHRQRRLGGRVRGAGRPDRLRRVEGRGRRHDRHRRTRPRPFGIRVVTVAPGIVDTPMMTSFSDEVRRGLATSVTFPQRLAAPSEFARLVTMVVEHDYLNGETIRMDGALRMTAR